MRIFCSLVALLVAGHLLGAKETHPETGKIQWNRDLAAAQAEAKSTGRPVLLLFQEVPGCSGCRQYGAEVLSHPEIVRAAENDFIPVFVYNNRPGPDAEILKRFGEPPWNYQVIRYLGADGRDLIPREDEVWSVKETAVRMARALRAAGRPVPASLSALAGDHLRPAANPSPATLTAAFAMDCFWEGEERFAKVRGVVATEAAFIDGREVVRLAFDPAVVAWADLVRIAEGFDCAHHVYAPNAELARATRTKRGVSVFDSAKSRRAPESDQKRWLRRG